jgi:hypothetical protein
VKALLLLTLFLFSSLFANKVLYLSYENIPDRVIKGEVFSITIKTISTVKNFNEIKYRFSNKMGVTILNTIPYREQKGKFYLETFKFIATRNNSRLPDIIASLDADIEYEKTTLIGPKLNVISLNPKQDFSNVIASSFEITEYKTTSYDNKHNIVVFTAIAQNTSLSPIKFKNVFKQGVESLSKNNVIDPKITYFVVIRKELEKFSFSYFNLQMNKFADITIPIVVDDDSVTTQTDLKPKDQSKEKLKVNIAIGIAIFIFLFAIFRRRFIYLILVLFPLAYIAYISIPAKDVCIKMGSNIHLLPVNNGTIFETTQSKYILTKEGSAQAYTKVKLNNEKIGWVRNEDLCTP